MAAVPVRDQSGGTCASCAAADLIDAWGKTRLFPHGYRHRTHLSSPLLLAIQHASKFEDGRIGGRALTDVLQTAQEHGTCDQGRLGRNETSREGITTREAYDDFEQRAKPVYDWLWTRWEATQAGRVTRTEAASEIACRLPANLLSGRSGPDYAASLRALNRATANEFFRDLFADACQGSQTERPALPSTESIGEVDRAMNALNQNLDLGTSALPMGLSYCANILTVGPHFHRKKHGCDPHVSTLIGRRWNAARRTCEYLIKNSWGTSCHHYAGSGNDCEGGKVWVNAFTLRAGLNSLTLWKP